MASSSTTPSSVQAGLAVEGWEWEQARELARTLEDEVCPELASQEGWGEHEWDRVHAFLEDQVTILRFLRRAKHSSSHALALVQKHTLFRLAHQIDYISLSSLSTQYPEAGLFYFLPYEKGVRDRLGRPVAVLNMREVRRTEDAGLDGLKEFVLWSFEVARRYLRDLKKQRSEPLVSFAVLVDVAGAGMTNLELELVPYLVDLGHNHFPGLCSRTLVLNSGWQVSGAWTILKRLLPASTLAKISFTWTKELLDTHIEPERLPKQYGGQLDYAYSPTTNHVLRHYAKAECSPLSHHHMSRPPSSHHTPMSSRPLSRKSSCETLADVFYGEKTVRSSAASMKGFSMTKLHEAAAKSVEKDQQAGGRKRKIESRSRSPSPMAPRSRGRTSEHASPVDNPFDSPTKSYSTAQPASATARTFTSPPRVNSVRDFRLHLPPPTFSFNTSPLASLQSTPSSSTLASPPPPTHFHPISPPRMARRFTSERRPSAEETNPVAFRTYVMELASHHASGLSTTSNGSVVSTPSGWRSPIGSLGPTLTPRGGRRTSRSRDREEVLRTFVLDENVAHDDSPSSDEDGSSSPPPSHVSHTPSPPPRPQPSMSIKVMARRRPTTANSSSVLATSRKRDILKTVLFLFLLQLQNLKSRFSLIPKLPALPKFSALKQDKTKESKTREVARRKSKSDIQAIIFAALLLAFRGAWGGALFGEGAFGEGSAGGLGEVMGEWGGKVVRGLVGMGAEGG